MMIPALLSRPSRARLLLVVATWAAMAGGITIAQSDDNASPATPSSPSANSTASVRRALREFDRFLDHHPVLEDELRLDATSVSNAAYLQKNPELRDFLKANPQVAEGLRIYPRYFLNRALLRQASAPLSFHELAPFKELFQRDPAIERELIRNPELIRSPTFLKSHAALHALFDEQPALARVFLPSDGSSPKPKK